MKDKIIGAQLYTVREFCKDESEFHKTLEKLKEIGYTRIQVSGVGPIPAKAIRKAADDFGLEIVCTHRPLNEFLEDLPELIRYHKEPGCSVAGLGAAPFEYFGSLDALCRFIKMMEAVVKTLKENGMVFAYHNHAVEFKKFDGKFAMHYMLLEGDEEAFCFIPDVYWNHY